jgi:uncharacterized protein YjiS (DUF1127 family)
MTLIETFRDWREQRRLAEDAASFPDSDLAGLGLSRAEFTDIARMTAARVARMEIMAGLHGVTDGMLDARPDLRTGMALTCARCGHVGQCTRELTNPDGATAQGCDFCPNAPAFTALAMGA